MAREKAPLVERIAKGTICWRIHRLAHDPLYFGPRRGVPPLHRFDAPGGQYHITYVGATREAAFAEVFLRQTAGSLIDLSEVRARGLTTLQTTRPLRIVALHGKGLARAGVTGAVTTGLDYPSSRQLAHTLWARPEAYDGLRYRARHDDDEFSLALFDRAAEAIDVIETRPLAEEIRWLAGLAERYGVDFTDG